MCGLVAAFGEGPELGPAMRRALAAMAHRGPDGEGLARLDEGRV